MLCKCSSQALVGMSFHYFLYVADQIQFGSVIQSDSSMHTAFTLSCADVE